jgi:hypothetical protein
MEEPSEPGEWKEEEEIRCVCMNLPGKPDGIEWQNL